MKLPNWFKPAALSFALAVVLTFSVTFLYVNPEVLRVERSGSSQADSLTFELVQNLQQLKTSVDSLHKQNARIWANEAARRAASDARVAEADRKASDAQEALIEALAAFEAAQALSVPTYEQPPFPSE